MHTKETKQKMRESKIGEKNPQWKGDTVDKTSSLHEWIRNYKPKPKVCEICKKNLPYDLANISGKYKRDITDFRWLCRKCHMENDGRLKKLIEKMTTWTKKEIKILNKYYPLKGTHIPELQKTHTRTGILCKANKLGLKCRTTHPLGYLIKKRKMKGG